MEAKLEPSILICEKCGKEEEHYVFNKFFYNRGTVDFCDQCTKELNYLLALEEYKPETTIGKFIKR